MAEKITQFWAEISDVEVDTYPIAPQAGIDYQPIHLTVKNSRMKATQPLHPSDARELAKLLIEAADVAEGK